MADLLQHGIASQYDRNATRYDRAARFNAMAAERLVASIPDGDYASLLDVGCGTGFATLAALDRLDIGRVTCVDISAEMIEQARAKLSQRPSVRATFLVSDVMA